MQYDIQQLYTLCGGHIAPIYVEAEKAGIQVIDVRHEANAVFAADATARLTGRPGVAVVTAGPGVTNSITALKNAQLAQSPVLLIGGATATLLKGRGALQDIDQMALVRPHVKWARAVRRYRELAPALYRALSLARQGVPGPVFLEIPVDLLYSGAMVREWYGKDTPKGRRLADRFMRWYIQRHVERLLRGDDAEPSGVVYPSPAPRPIRSAQLYAAGRSLAVAARPLLIMGSGALLSPGPADALATAVKQIGIPVYLSGQARGLLCRQAPLQFRHQRRRALREADWILLAGTPGDFRLSYGRDLNRQAFQIAVNRDRAALKKNLNPRIAIVADPARWVIALADSGGKAQPGAAWLTTLQERENAREQEIERMAGESVEGINPLQLFRCLEDQLPERSVLIADGGDFAATAAYTLRPRRPLAWLDPGAFGTLGVGAGFALGAAVQYPDDYIWIIYGDGSAAYSLTEFDTLAKMGLKVCAVIGNNGAWQQIARDQVPLLGQDTATRLPRSDYERIAEAFGAAGERVTDSSAFPGAIRRAIAHLDRGVPYVINAIIGNTPFRQGSVSM